MENKIFHARFVLIQYIFIVYVCLQQIQKFVFEYH